MMTIPLLILGLGIAIPFTLVILFNLWVKARAGDNYQLDLFKLAAMYLIALVGWAITFIRV